MPKFGESISEQFAEKNKELGKKVEDSKERKEESDRTPLKSRLSPFYWLERKWARESFQSNKQTYDEMLKKVKEHGAEIQEEANGYVVARGEYESAQQNLALVVGIEPTMVNMNKFIEEVDTLNRFLPKPENSAEASQEEYGKVIERWHKKNGEVLAAADLFMPSLPIAEQPGGHKGSTVKIGEYTYRTKWGGERIPRLEIGRSLEDALQEAKSKGVQYVFELSSGVSYRYGGEVDRQAKYVVLDDESAKSLKSSERFLGGTTPLYDEGPMFMNTPPWATIDFEYKVVSVEELEKRGEKTSITLKFEVEDSLSGGKKEKSIKLNGSLDELRKEVGKHVIQEEWAPGSETNIVHNATVEINGQEVSWEEFINSSSEERK